MNSEKQKVEIQSKAAQMNELFDDADRSIGNLLKYIDQLGYIPPGAKFVEYLQTAHFIIKHHRVFEADLDGRIINIPVGELDNFHVIDKGLDRPVVREIGSLYGIGENE